MQDIVTIVSHQRINSHRTSGYVCLCRECGQPAAHELYARGSLLGFMRLLRNYQKSHRCLNNVHNNKIAYKVLSLSFWCVLFTINLAEQRYVSCVWVRNRWGDFHVCPCVYGDVALCGNTVRNGLLVSDWLATPGSGIACAFATDGSVWLC